MGFEEEEEEIGASRLKPAAAPAAYGGDDDEEDDDDYEAATEAVADEDSTLSGALFFPWAAIRMWSVHEKRINIRLSECELGLSSRRRERKERQHCDVYVIGLKLMKLALNSIL